MTIYKNPWYKPQNPMYGPENYSTDEKPVLYCNYLVYERIKGHVWDVVKDGTCVTQLAGLNGAKKAIDELQAADDQGAHNDH
jgi:hypothetical protein